MITIRYLKSSINVLESVNFYFEKLELLNFHSQLLDIFNKYIFITTNLEESIKDANIIVIAVPVKFVTNVILELKKYYKEESSD